MPGVHRTSGVFRLKRRYIMFTVNFKPIENSDASVVGYVHDLITEMPVHREKYPVMVVVPGGGYSMVSQREADPIAFEYLAAGYNVFTLTYSVGEKAKDFQPLKELSQTVMTIRENAEKWNCDPEKIACVGFSAGGHLCASLATMWDSEEFKKVFDTKNGLNKPNAAVLSYPVITADEFAHKGSILNVSGCEEGTEEYKFFGLDNQVSDKTCPCFIWHTVEDNAVPVENTIKFITALQENQISFECHIFPTGHHGLSVCTEETGYVDPYNGRWMPMSIEWLGKVLNYKK